MTNAFYRALTATAQSDPDQSVLESATAILTAENLLENASALACKIRSSGFQRVALQADNSPDWVIADLACQIADIILVPVPTFFTDDQVSHLLKAAAIECWIKPHNGEFSIEALTQSPGANVQIPPGTGKITFTSGSTGQPKGVCLSTAQCLDVARSLGDVIDTPSPRHLCILPLSTLLENIAGIYMPQLLGGTSVVLSPGDLGMDGSSGIQPEKFLQALENTQPNTLILVPQMLILLDRALAKGWQPPTSLEFVAVGGARVSSVLVNRVRRRGLPVYEGYGLSECASVVSLNGPGADKADTSGRVLPHVQVVEREGELMVRGNSFLGYLNQPDSWNQAEVATGDLGHIDSEGFITVSGRRKNTLITSYGRNVCPEWIESELLASGNFAQVVVVGDSRPWCSAVLTPLSADVSDADIQRWVDNTNIRLPDYARIGGWLKLMTPLSVSAGLLTENGRPRRDAIHRAFAMEIDNLYANQQEPRYR